jgi:2-oxoglutarate ferredoxin oxidoreductase subunit beta
MTRTFTKAINHKGFSFIEILSPCPTLYMRKNKMGIGVDMMKWFKDNSIIKNGEGTSGTELDFDDGNKVVIGEFVNKKIPSFDERYNSYMKEYLGDRFVPYEGNK